jgi:beta-glucosidase-like glycosyl hydrolase/CubicO group peptidase (beta-lactamase class C family)
MNMRILFRTLALAGTLLLAGLPLVGQYHANLDQSNAQEAIWVDSVFRSMTFEQRLGQLFMIRAHSNLGSDHVAAVERLIRDYHVGGLCFFQGTPEAQIRLINQYQAQANLPMMVAMDAEWGLNMRMKSVQDFPRQLMLGAIRNNGLIYELGSEVARQMHRVGVHVNFAPVVDVNNNANNPVIGTRSFGEDRLNVAIKGVNYMRGMQDNGIVACAKHFPGHGDTDVDSHFDLPIIPHSRQRLDSIELYPFRSLINHGVGSIMVAHLQVPALEPRENYPTSLSPATVNGVLRDELDFHGLTFTDGLEMKGVTKHFGDGEVEAASLLAGNDILLLPESLANAEMKIKQYLQDGQLSEAEFNRKIKRVLRAKYRMGLQAFTPIAEENALADLNSAEALALKEELIENALTLVRNEGNLLPVKVIAKKQSAALAIGSSKQTVFQQRLQDYSPVDLLYTDTDVSAEEATKLLNRLAGEDLVIVSLHNMGRSASNDFGIKSSTLKFLQRLNEQNDVVLVVFGNPYSLKFFDEQGVVVAAYDDDDVTQDKTAQAIFGAIGFNGRLPITASPASPYNAGLSTSKLFRMGYGVPESVGMSTDSLQRYVRAIAQDAIDTRATPGCVVLVARYGKVVLHEAFGHHTYAREREVSKDDIYDLASVTKVAATTLALMDLVQTGQLDLDQTLGHYLPELAGTNKDQLVIREILAHRSALQPWIPFYTGTMDKRGRRSEEFYRSAAGGDYNIQVSDNIFLRENYIDTIWESINQSDLLKNKNYRYSDLGFYYLARLVEKLSHQGLNDYVRQRFYEPLGLFNIDFLPRERFSLNRIPPTEIDNYWRKQTVHGDVHDMGAAMLGGVSGHAGLFGDAHDLAVLWQMLLQRGIYGNHVYLKPEIVREFTSRFEDETRRGLGFDMKQLNPNRSQNIAQQASSRTFGHLGFTGTCVWADPAEELVVVFLSNRTYPSMRNNKLGRENYRPKIQAAAYNAIIRRMASPPVPPIGGATLPEKVESGTLE